DDEIRHVTRNQSAAGDPRRASPYPNRLTLFLPVLTLLAGGIRKIAEEFGVRLDHHPRVVRAQPRLIGLHRAIEGEEVGIALEGFRKDAVALGIAFAAGLLGLR